MFKDTTLRFLLTAIACCVLFFSCSRDTVKHKVRFYGHVEDKYTHYPIAYAKIVIYQDHGSFGGSTLHAESDTLGPTDADGNYDFKTKGIIKEEDSYNCYLRFFGRGFNNYLYSDRWEVDEIDNRENHIDVQLYTMCRIGYVFVNANPVDANDLVSNIYIDRPWGQQKFEQGDPSLVGTSVNTTLWTTYYGYTTSVLHYTVTKNSVATTHTDTVYTPDAFAGAVVWDTISY